jgi:hypothetical protein
MPQSQIVTLGDAIVADLNGQTFSQAFVAERGCLPTYELTELNALKVSVVPNQDEGRLDTRHLSVHEYTIDIGIQIKPPDISNTSLDPYVYLTQEIVDYFQFERAHNASFHPPVRPPFPHFTRFGMAYSLPVAVRQ